MDHDLYEFQSLTNRPAGTGPDAGRVALSVVIVLENYRMVLAAEPPFRPETAPWRPWRPDFPHFSWRDYGPRVGIFRLLALLREFGITPGVVLPGSLTLEAPALIDALLNEHVEIIGTTQFSDQVLAQEAALEDIGDSLATLRASGALVTGWMSPGQAQPTAALGELRRNGIRYVLDWCHDDLPVRLTTRAGSIYSVPCPWDLSDAHQCFTSGASPSEFAQQFVDQVEAQHAEAIATNTARWVNLPLHAWIAGQPFRVRALRRALETTAGRWSRTDTPGALLSMHAG